MRLLTVLFQSCFSSDNCYLLINVPSQEHIRSKTCYERFRLMGDLRKTMPEIELTEVQILTLSCIWLDFVPPNIAVKSHSESTPKDLFPILLATISTNTLGFLLIFTSTVLSLWYVKFCCLPGTHQLITSSSQQTWRENKMKKSVGQDKDRGITRQLLILHQQNRHNPGKINLISAKNRIRWWETKTKPKTPSPTSAFFPSTTSLLCSQLFYLLSLSPSSRGMGVMISPHPFFCAVPSLSPFPLLHCGPLPQDAVLLSLLQRGSLPQRAVFQGQTASG